MADSLSKVEVTPVSPTIVSVETQSENVVSVVQSNALITLSTTGPQISSNTTLASLTDVDLSNKVDNSVVYYDGNSDTFKADSLNTILTITDGGNF